MILVIEIEQKDIKKTDPLYALELITCLDYEYSTYETMSEFEEQMDTHADKKEDDNYVFVIDIKAKTIKVMNIQTEIRAVLVE